MGRDKASVTQYHNEKVRTARQVKQGLIIWLAGQEMACWGNEGEFGLSSMPASLSLPQ